MIFYANADINWYEGIYYYTQSMPKMDCLLKSEYENR